MSSITLISGLFSIFVILYFANLIVALWYDVNKSKTLRKNKLKNNAPIVPYRHALLPALMVIAFTAITISVAAVLDSQTITAVSTVVTLNNIYVMTLLVLLSICILGIYMGFRDLWIPTEWMSAAYLIYVKKQGWEDAVLAINAEDE